MGINITKADRAIDELMRERALSRLGKLLNLAAGGARRP